MGRRRAAPAVLGCLLASISCEDGERHPVDAGSEPDAPPAEDAGSEGEGELDPLTPVAGLVRLLESEWGASADVRFMSAAWPTGQELVDRSGACALYRARVPAFCDPACDFDELCLSDGECMPSPHRLSAGRVEIEAAGWSTVAEPDETGWYALDGVPEEDLFDSGDGIRVGATGAEVPAFDVPLRGVATARMPSREVSLVDGRDNVIEIVPEDDGARVELVLQTGWHGSPAEGILWCTATAGATSITIPAPLVEGFPPTGGVGLLPHPSFLRRVHRVLVDGPAGPIEVSAASEANLDVLH